MSSRSRVTLADVSRESGFSPATVSMILSGRADVSFSAETIRMVRETADGLGYVAVSRKRPALFDRRTVLIVCPNVLNPYYATLVQSIQQAGRTVGKDIYLVGVDALAEAVQDVLDGNMTGTVLNDDVGQATAAADATKLYVEGSAVEQYYWVDYVKVTKDNASQYVK